MAKEPEVIKYIRETRSKDMSGNYNQYKFKLAENSEILLSKSCYERLLQITNICALHTNEHNSILYGFGLNPNQIYFSLPDESRDYSSEPQGVAHGVQQISEIENKISRSPDDKVLIICNLHTHPYGILKNQDGSPSLQHNFISGLDINGGTNFRQYVKSLGEKYAKKVDAVDGLIAIDNENGNSMISFVWYADDKHYRFNNVKVVEPLPNGQFNVIKDLHKDGFDYIERNFGME